MRKPKTSKIQSLPDVERVPISSLRPYWRNPRKNDAAVPAVKESIQRYGMNQPLVVDSKGVIVVGHTRYRALVELGVEEVPVVRPKLTKQQASEYRIADNKSNELAEWDKGALIPELRGLQMPANMAIFFLADDLGRLLADAGKAYIPVTDDKMDKVLDRQNKGMANLTRPRLDTQIKLQCPGCGEEFFVDRHTLDNHPGER